MALRVSITIDKPIGEKDEYYAAYGMESPCFSPSDMAEFIAGNADADEFVFNFRCIGGCLNSGLDIHDQMIALTAAGKKVIVNGYKVNSIATAMFLAAEPENRFVAEHVEFIIHNPWYDGAAYGMTADGLQELANYVKEAEEKLLNLYITRCGLDETQAAEVAELMKKETDLGSALAIQYGFASGKITTVNALKKDPSKPVAYMPRIAAQIKSKHKTDTMSKELSEKFDKLAKDIKAMFSPKVKAESKKLADETSIYFEGELAVDTPVFSDEEMTAPLADGSYELEDKRTVTVAGGKVTEIKDAPEEKPDDTAASTEVNALKAQLKAQTDENKRLKDGLKTVNENLTSIKAMIVPGDKGGQTTEVPQTKAQQFLAERRAVRDIKSQQ